MTNYIGSGKKSQYGVKVTIDLEKAKPHIYDYKGKKYLTFDINEKKETDQYGKTHSVSVFTKDEQQQQSKADEEYKNNSNESDDLPF